MGALRRAHSWKPSAGFWMVDPSGIFRHTPSERTKRKELVVRQSFNLIVNEDLIRKLEEKDRELAQSNCDLAAREARLRALFESKWECVNLLAADGTLLEMNPAGLRMIEADSFEQVKNHCIYPLVVEAHRPAFRDLVEKAFLGESKTLDFQIVGLAGTRRWLATHATPLRDEDGGITAMLGTTRDITERKHAEQARQRTEDTLRESKRRVDTLFHASPAAICVNTVDTGRIIDINEQFARFTGFARQELIGRTIFDMNFWVNPEARPAMMTRLKADRSLSNVETQFQRKNGEVRDVLVSCELVELAGETSPVTISMFLDVTERKRAEEKLRASEERFRELAETIEDVFWITDPANTRILYVSPAYEKIWGRSCQSLRDRPHSWLEVIHPEDRDRVLHAATRRMLAGIYDVEYRIVRLDGQVRWIRDRAFPVRHAGGQVERILGVARDITERLQMGEQFRQSQKLEAIGQLAGGVAHDFNNILAVIMMQVELTATTENLTEEVRDGLQQIRSAAERAADLIRQLLIFSRRQVMQWRSLDLNEVVTNHSRMLQRIIGENVRLHLHCTRRHSQHAPTRGCLIRC